ncbi:TPA: phage tail tape measure protein [Streptococcus suis]
MAGKIKGIQIEIGGNTQPLEKALKSTSDSAKATSTEIKKIDQALKFDPSNIVLLTQKQELLGKQIATNKEKLSALKQAQSEVEAKFKSGDIGAEEYRAFQREIEVTKNVLGAYENKLENVSQALTGNANEVKSNTQTMKGLQEETNNLLKADLLNEFSGMIADASQQLIEFGQNSLEAFRTVDEGMDTIVTKTGAGGQSLEEMQNIASNLATTIPTDFTTAGSAVGEVNTQFGLMGDALQTTAADMIKFAEINGTDVTSATQTSKQALEAYGLSVDYLSDVLDSATYVAQNTGVSVDDLMKKAVDGAPQIKALGLSFDEGVSLIGKFEKAGVDSSAALSSMSKAAVAYAKDGKTLQEGLNDTVTAIQNSSSETEALTLASEVFGSKAAPRMVDAIKSGTLNLNDLGAAAEESAGTVSSTFDATLDPIDKFTTAQNITTEGMAEIGGMIAEVVAPLMESLARIFRDAATWVGNLPGPIKTAIVAIGGIVAAAGLLLPIVTAIQTGWPLITAMFAKLAPVVLSLLGPITGVIAAVVALVAAFTYLWNTNESFREGVQKAWSAIQEAISTVVQFIADFIKQTFGIVVNWWKENQELILSSARTVWNAIKSVVSAVMKFIEPLIKATMKNIQTVITAVWKIVKTVIQGNLKIILGIVKAVMQALSGDWSGAWKTIQKVVDTALKMMKTVITTILSAIVSNFTNSWNTLVSFLSNVWSNIVAIGKSVFENLKSFLASMWQSVSQTASSIWSGIVSTLSNFWNSILTTGQNIFNSIKDFIGNIWNTISTTASTVWNALVTTLTFIWNSIYNTAMTVFNSIKDFIGNIWNTISTTASTVWNTITSFLGGVWNGILQTGSNIFNTIKTTISNVFNEISGIATRIWNGIKDTISNTINGAKDIVKRAIDTIKGFFNFDWSLPRIRIPKFDISGGEAPWGFGGQGSMPSVGVRWEYFAKGGILTKPTAFGMRGNNVMVGGEAGAEAVLPLNESTLGMIGDRIMATVTDKIAVNVKLPEGQPITINLDGKTVAHMLVPFISQEQADRMIIIENGGTL